MSDPSVIIIRFSSPDADLWRSLVEETGLSLSYLAPGDVSAVPRASAVVLSAAGNEAAAVEWIESHPASPGVPIYVVGTDPGRRVAVRALTAGAADYFALPDDIELLRAALRGAQVAANPGGTPEGPRPTQLDEIASWAARAALDANGGNVSQAARQLHISRGRLRRLVKVSAPGDE